jgi:hypothetical protein
MARRARAGPGRACPGRVRGRRPWASGGGAVTGGSVWRLGLAAVLGLGRRRSSGRRFSVLGSRSSVLGPRSSVLGPRSSVLGPRFSVLGPRSSVLGPRSSVLSPRRRNGGLGGGFAARAGTAGLTSYIVAAAIMTPPTGYLAGRFGLKRLFLISVAGFTVASMLCGMSQSLVPFCSASCKACSVRRSSRSRRPC